MLFHLICDAGLLPLATPCISLEEIIRFPTLAGKQARWGLSDCSADTRWFSRSACTCHISKSRTVLRDAIIGCHVSITAA